MCFQQLNRRPRSEDSALTHKHVRIVHKQGETRTTTLPVCTDTNACIREGLDVVFRRKNMFQFQRRDRNIHPYVLSGSYVFKTCEGIHTHTPIHTHTHMHSLQRVGTSTVSKAPDRSTGACRAFTSLKHRRRFLKHL